MFPFNPRTCYNTLYRQIPLEWNNMAPVKFKLDSVQKGYLIYVKNQENKEPKFIRAQVQIKIVNHMLLVKINGRCRKVNSDQCCKYTEPNIHTEPNASDWWLP